MAKKPATPSAPTSSRTGVGMNKVMDRASTPKAPEAPKTEKPAAAPKQTFGQAFSAARKAADGAGGKFTYGGKEFQTNIKGEKYSSVDKLKNVNPKGPEAPTSNDTEPKTNKPETESGKKKMSEDTNPLISAFLDLQAKNPANMFEAAKKAKKDYDKDGKVESPKDEVWGSRFRAAKAAGKMEEGMIDPKDPSVQGSGDVTSTPAKKTSMPKPTAPKTDSSVQGSGDVTMNGKPARVKEEAEVTFSQAEIDHINSFFLEASVAPNRPEVAAEARPDSVKDGVSQNDVTGTSTEGGKKKIKEETEKKEYKKLSYDEFIKGRIENPTPEQHKEIGRRLKKAGVPGSGWHFRKAKEMQKNVKEETQIDEISKKTLRSYLAKKKDRNKDYATPESFRKGMLSPNLAKDKIKGKNVKVHAKEETQIDEVSKELLKRYTNKVAKGGLDKAYEKDTKIADPEKRHLLPNYNKRLEYGFKATAKIAKEETQIDEHKSMDGDPLKVGDSVGFKDGHEQYGKIHSISPQGHAKVKVWDSEAGEHYHVTKHVSRLWKETNEEVELDEISKNLAKSYTDKSKTNISDLNKATPYLNKMYLNAKTSKDKKHYEKTFNKNMETIDRRKKGIEMAGKVLSKEEVELEEGRPRKNPTPETSERDPRKHIQVEAGRAAAGNVVDFHHNDGSKSKITPAMGRKITSHLQSLKPAERQAAVNKMHASAEGLKV
jgi:hypothetical protein